MDKSEKFEFSEKWINKNSFAGFGYKIKVLFSLEFVKRDCER